MSSFQHHIIVAIDSDTLLFVLITGMMMRRVHSKGACIVVSCKYICMGDVGGEGGAVEDGEIVPGFTVTDAHLGAQLS